MAIDVTAKQSGASPNNGMLLRIEVLTNTAANQSGAAVANQSAPLAHEATITTTVAGSLVYGALVNADAVSLAGTFTPNVLPIIDDLVDTINGQCYATMVTNAPTITPGPETIGSVTSFAGGLALLEILPSGVITTDASSPPPASTFAAQTVTSAVFDPPPGSLLVAMVTVAAQFADAIIMTVSSSGGLVWTERVTGVSSGNGYTGVWTARVPAAGPALIVSLAPQAGTDQFGEDYFQGASVYERTTPTVGLQATATGFTKLIAPSPTGAFGAAITPAAYSTVASTDTTQFTVNTTSLVAATIGWEVAADDSGADTVYELEFFGTGVQGTAANIFNIAATINGTPISLFDFAMPAGVNFSLRARQVITLNGVNATTFLEGLAFGGSANAFPFGLQNLSATLWNPGIINTIEFIAGWGSVTGAPTFTSTMSIFRRGGL